MKFVKNAGKSTVVITKDEWLQIGQKAKWLPIQTRLAGSGETEHIEMPPAEKAPTFEEVLQQKETPKRPAIPGTLIRKPAQAAYEAQGPEIRFSFYNTWAPEFNGDIPMILKSWGCTEVFEFPGRGKKKSELKMFAAKMPDGDWAFVTGQARSQHDPWAHMAYWGHVKSVKAKDAQEAYRKIFLEHVNPQVTFNPDGTIQ